MSAAGVDDPARARAEADLLRHLALIGELCERRESLAGQLAALDKVLAQARHQKPVLIRRLEELGGALPSWEL